MNMVGVPTEFHPTVLFYCLVKEKERGGGKEQKKRMEGEGEWDHRRLRWGGQVGRYTEEQEEEEPYLVWCIDAIVTYMLLA